VAAGPKRLRGVIGPHRSKVFGKSEENRSHSGLFSVVRTADKDKIKDFVESLPKEDVLTKRQKSSLKHKLAKLTQMSEIFRPARVERLVRINEFESKLVNKWPKNPNFVNEKRSVRVSTLFTSLIESKSTNIDYRSLYRLSIIVWSCTTKQFGGILSKIYTSLRSKASSHCTVFDTG
jgi:hypothetical protein